MLPGVDGFTLCASCASSGLTVPVLMLTARDATADKVTGLDSGADDYLVKPFAFEELLARIRTLLRRPRHVLPPHSPRRAAARPGDGGEARVGGEPLELSPKELSLLELFMRHPGEALSRDRILDTPGTTNSTPSPTSSTCTWGGCGARSDRPGRGVALEAVRGVGYALRAEPGDEAKRADGR